MHIREIKARLQRVTARRLRGGAWIALAVAVFLVLFVALGASRPAARGTGGRGASPAVAAPGGAATASRPLVDGSPVGGAGDWTHVEAVLALLQRRPPTEPLVVLLGGSAARESTTSDRGPGSWAADVAAAGGGHVRTYNLGTRMQSFERSLAIVKYLPRGTLVLVGVNLGRFAQRADSPQVRLPRTLPGGSYAQHAYAGRAIHTDAGKAILVQRWLGQSYTHFKERYAANAHVLTELVKECKRRGLRPVLLDLPRNLDVIGHVLDQPLARMTATCRRVATAQHIPWVSFVAKAHIPSSGFYDQWHLVRPGQIVWQKYLSAVTVQMLAAASQAGG
jgi:hypothetical protein